MPFEFQNLHRTLLPTPQAHSTLEQVECEGWTGRVANFHEALGIQKVRRGAFFPQTEEMVPQTESQIKRNGKKTMHSMNIPPGQEVNL